MLLCFFELYWCGIFVGLVCKDMGDSACLRRSFSHPPSDSSREAKEVSFPNILESFFLFGFWILSSCLVNGFLVFSINSWWVLYFIVTAFVFLFFLFVMVCLDPEKTWENDRTWESCNGLRLIWLLYLFRFFHLTTTHCVLLLLRRFVDFLFGS